MELNLFLLLSKTAIEKWSRFNKQYYVEAGYKFTKMNDTFEVKIEDLSKTSNAIVKLTCDYCGAEYSISWKQFVLREERVNKKGSCLDPKCRSLRLKETMILKYGVENAR